MKMTKRKKIGGEKREERRKITSAREKKKRKENRTQGIKCNLRKWNSLYGSRMNICLQSTLE